MDERQPFNRKEHAFFMDLILLRNTMIKNADAMRERLCGMPGGFRDLKLMMRLAEKIQYFLSETIPDSSLRRYQEVAKNGKYTLDLQGPVPRKEFRVISVQDLSDVAEAAIKGQCALCMLEGKEIKRCPLHKALLTIAPPTEVSRIGCEYRTVAGDLEAGREVRL